MFKYMVLLSGLMLAGCAAWFSVYGISQFYSGAETAALIMAISLELGKLVAVSYVYRYWDIAHKLLRSYMIVGAIVLSLITSWGVYSFLSSAYSTVAVDYKLQSAQVANIDTERQSFIGQIESNNERMTQLNDIRLRQEIRLDSLVGKNGFITQQRTIQNTESEIRNLRTETQSLQQSADSLLKLSLTTESTISDNSKITTFSYIADLFGISLDTMMVWFTLIIVLVFDPMAVALVIAYNSIQSSSKNKQSEDPQTLPEDDLPIDKPTNDIVVLSESPIAEASTLPYYMHPDYDWGNDPRWLSDESAKTFRRAPKAT